MFDQIVCYLAELFRQIVCYLVDMFRQIVCYLAELFHQIAFPIEKSLKLENRNRNKIEKQKKSLMNVIHPLDL